MPSADDLRIRRALAELQGRRRRRRPKRVRPPRYPQGVRTAYTIAIRRVVSTLGEVLRETVFPELQRVVEEAQDLQRVDSPPDDVRELFEQAKGVFGNRVGEDDLREIITTAARDVEQFNGRELDRIFGNALGFNPIPVIEPYLSAEIQAFVQENITLIRGLTDQAFAQAESVVLRGVRQGLRYEEISASLRERISVSRSRADLIARDQVGKLMGELTRVRQRAAGAKRYRWSTSQDERVRPGHRRLNNTIQSWDERPDVGGGRRAHPGEDIQCRCSAIPIVEDILEELDPDGEAVPEATRLPDFDRGEVTRRR